MRTITLEEHFASPKFLDGPGRELKEKALKFRGPAATLLEQLCDLGDKRIAEMDAAHIDMQILSLTSPGTEQLEVAEAKAFAREANDYLADAVRSHPARIGGFATLPTADPSAAAAELERTIRDYGFKGAVINGHVQGRYLDDKFFWPIFERAEALHVPIYLHPTPPPKPVIEASYGGFAPIVTDLFAGPGWGWHIETAIHVIRIILGGTFDRYPGLQLVVGHMGETLPFMLQRLDVMPMAMTKLSRPISSYLRENIHYTFSGFNFTPTFLDLLLQVGVDRIMFSADYPYSSMSQARAFLDQLPVSSADRERIAHGNAERLLGL
ncbi:MAG TPA: amidohydrolase family protein [Alloacidobacterium sp.]|jgi:predicted TIM-barrel fold metal-dependent hydrolase|nr:amidohydrolase family protein [Alloacidobacterium sp.]